MFLAALVLGLFGCMATNALAAGGNWSGEEWDVSGMDEGGFDYEAIRNRDTITPDEQAIIDICRVNGLHRNQVILLRHEGYTDAEIREMSREAANGILTAGMSEEEREFYYTHIAPRQSEAYRERLAADLALGAARAVRNMDKDFCGCVAAVGGLVCTTVAIGIYE